MANNPNAYNVGVVLSAVLSCAGTVVVAMPKPHTEVGMRLPPPPMGALSHLNSSPY